MRALQAPQKGGEHWDVGPWVRCEVRHFKLGSPSPKQDNIYYFTYRMNANGAIRYNTEKKRTWPI